MVRHSDTQEDRAVRLLGAHGMIRHAELTKAGITGATVARMKAKGLIVQLGRGLYQLADAPLDGNHTLAEAAKAVPRGIVCLVSALAFHGLTDTLPPRVWIAIGAKDWRPRVSQPALQIVRFNAAQRATGIEHHTIEGVTVPITSPARTIADLFRYRQRAGRRYQNSPGLNLALEGLSEALRQRKATPAEIARVAGASGIWSIVQPYMEAMLAHGQ